MPTKARPTKQEKGKVKEKINGTKFPNKGKERKYLQLFPKETKERGPGQGNMNLNLYLTHKITCIHFLTKQKREKKKENYWHPFS